MTAIIIDFAEKRLEREERERRKRIDAFDRELRRRLALHLDAEAETAPVEPLKDNPYV